jgi:hypothetical protein
MLVSAFPSPSASRAFHTPPLVAYQSHPAPGTMGLSGAGSSGTQQSPWRVTDPETNVSRHS